MQSEIHLVTDRPPLRETVRRDRRRGAASGFERALGDEQPAPRDEHSSDELVPARRAADVAGEAGTKLDVLA